MTRNVVDSPDVVAPLFVGSALLGQRRAGARGVHAFGRAAHLTRRLADRLGGLEPEARDPLRRLPALDLGAREARLFVAAAERIAHGDADAPRRIVRGERLAERVAEASVARAGDDARKSAGAQELRAAETVAAIRGFEPHVGQPLIVEKLDVRRRVFEVVPARARSERAPSAVATAASTSGTEPRFAGSSTGSRRTLQNDASPDP